jgi:hypothetical protein
LLNRNTKTSEVQKAKKHGDKRRRKPPRKPLKLTLKANPKP